MSVGSKTNNCRCPLRGEMLALSLCLVVLASGCASLGLDKNPFASKPKWDPKWSSLECAKQSDNPRERTFALQDLKTKATSKSPEEQLQTVAELATLLQNENDPYFRVIILQTIAVHQVSRVDDVLQQAAQDTNKEMRITACTLMATRTGDAPRAGLIRAITEEDDLDVRLEAARGLGIVGGPGAKEILGKLLEETDPALQYRAMQSLEQIEKKGYGNDVNAWKDYLAGRAVNQKTPTIAERMRMPWY